MVMALARRVLAAMLITFIKSWSWLRQDLSLLQEKMITGNENQDAPSKKRFKTCENDGPGPWSDLNHDILYLIMMQLGVFDIHAFSGVCKSWRSFALSNWSKFMASMPRLEISLSINDNGQYYIDGRRFKTIIPHSAGRNCVGFTCEYMVLFGSKTNDFWLVNPFTRQELHFPDIPSLENNDSKRIRAILVYSPSMSGWVLVMTDGSTNIWFSIAGQGAWNHVSSTFPVVDLHAFKRKIYTLNNASHLCELRLKPDPKLTLLETKNFPNLPTHRQFYSSRGILYVKGYLSEGSHEFHKLNFDKMKWILSHKNSKHCPANGKGKRFVGRRHHDCLNDSVLDD